MKTLTSVSAFLIMSCASISWGMDAYKCSITSTPKTDYLIIKDASEVNLYQRDEQRDYQKLKGQTEASVEGSSLYFLHKPSSPSLDDIDWNQQGSWTVWGRISYLSFSMEGNHGEGSIMSAPNWIRNPNDSSEDSKRPIGLPAPQKMTCARL